MNDKGKPHLFRRTFIVDRGFQFEMIFRAACYCAGLLMVLAAGAYYPLIVRIRSGRDDNDAATAMLYMHEHLWPVALLCVILAMIISIHLTNRIAGPLYRMKRRLVLLGTGVFARPTVTRKRDYLKDEVVVLNDAIESVAMATDEIKAAEREVSLELESCLGLLRDYEREELNEAIARLEEKTAILHEKIHYFQRVERRKAGDQEEPARDKSLSDQPTGRAAVSALD